MLDLETLFQTIAETEGNGENRFIARSIPGFSEHRLAKGEGNAPVLLISVDNATSIYTGPPVNLEHLNVRHNVECLITREDGTQEAKKFTVIRCIGKDAILIIGASALDRAI